MLQYFVDGFFVFSGLVSVATIWEACRDFRSALHLLSRGPEFEIPIGPDINIGISQPRVIKKPVMTKSRVMLHGGAAQSAPSGVATPLCG